MRRAFLLSAIIASLLPVTLLASSVPVAQPCQVQVVLDGQPAQIDCPDTWFATPTPLPPTATAVPPTDTPQPTATEVPTSTPTQIPPTATTTALPTPTPTAAPTSTATATATATATSPVAGQQCPTWVHDQYVTTGPDGKSYPTWHPPVDPVFGCVFGHEHGADPRTSLANNTMPAFGYIGGLIGDNEPHTGFKVFVINNGDPTSPNGPAPQADYRVVFHMGSSGVARYSTQYHSAQYDYVARDGSGREAHLMAMVDTGPTSQDGSLCDDPRRGAKDFSTLGCDNDYEIWTKGMISIVDPNGPYGRDANPLQAIASLTFGMAVADPITTRNPLDNTSLIYTETVKTRPDGQPPADPVSTAAYYRGCKRDLYVGPEYFNNANGQAIYYTDVSGVVQPGPGPSTIRQQVSTTSWQGFDEQAAVRDFCDPTVHSPN